MFNSRTKEALFDAKIENATLKIELESGRRDYDRIAAEHRALRHDTDLYRDQVAALEKDKAVLLERLDLLANHLPPPPTQAFSTLSEETEDADYALRAGLIDRDEYEAILASAGALNTEITFDSDTLSHL